MAIEKSSCEECSGGSGIRRVAVICDAQGCEPERMTGLYCRRALGQLVDVEHFQPRELNEIPRDQFDLFLRIGNAGQAVDFVADLKPSVICLSGEPSANDVGRDSAEFDVVLVPRMATVERLRQQGINAVWLPPACDPELHYFPGATNSDVTFVGDIRSETRSELIGEIKNRHPGKVICAADDEEAAAAMLSSRIVVDLSAAPDDRRLMEVLCSGALLLTATATKASRIC